MAVKAFVFDCDGTILDTLPDLVTLTNETLKRQGFPTHTTEEIMSYVGHGAKALIVAAGPPDASEDRVHETLLLWRSLYPEYGFTKTAPYEGIVETLEYLKQSGAKLAVLSNKFDKATQEVVQRNFPGLFDVVHGECERFPRKPDPQGLRTTMEELGTTPETTAYVGDSPVDAQVAHAAGCLDLCVAWGYHPKSDLEEAGARHILEHPKELIGFYE